MSMVMYDSNVIIDILHGKLETNDEKVCICGIIKAELLHGARSENNYNELLQMMSELYYVPLEESQWENIGKKLYELRINGITVPINDVIIYEICAKNNITLRTQDKHFKLINNLFGEIMISD